MSHQPVSDLNVRLPSYARPTQSSQARDHQRSPTKQRSKSDTPSKPPRRPTTNRDFRSYLFTTIAFRNSARYPQPFRFFDLPSEVRNHIYDFMGLQRPQGREPLQLNLLEPATLPRLLQVDSQQLRAEAGSYVFRAHEIEMSTDPSLARLTEFLADMGPANCRLLAAHPRLRLRLIRRDTHAKAFKRAWERSTRSAAVTTPIAKKAQDVTVAANKTPSRVARLRAEEQQRRRSQCFVQRGMGFTAFGTQYCLHHVWSAAFELQMRYPTGWWEMREQCEGRDQTVSCT